MKWERPLLIGVVVACIALFVAGKAVAAFWVLAAPFALLLTVAICWGGLIAFWVVVTYARGPSHRPALEPANAAAVPFLQQTALERFTRELIQAGFAPAGDFMVDGPQFCRLFVDSARTSTAGLSAVAHPSGPQTWATVSTVFEDGRFQSTTNRTHCHVLAIPDGSGVLRRPGASIAELLETHRDRISGTFPIERVPDDAVPYMLGHLNSQFELYLKSRLMRRTGSDTYRFTWRGAWRAVRIALSPSVTVTGEEILVSNGAPAARLTKVTHLLTALELLCSLAVLGAFYLLIFRVGPDEQLPYQLTVVGAGAGLCLLWVVRRNAERGRM